MGLEQPFLGYEVYSLGNQETGRYESGGGFILPNFIGDCEDGFEIDPATQTCVAIKFNPPQSVKGGQGFVLGCTESGASNFNPSATQDDGSCVSAHRNSTSYSYSAESDLIPEQLAVIEAYSYAAETQADSTTTVVSNTEALKSLGQLALKNWMFVGLGAALVAYSFSVIDTDF